MVESRYGGIEHWLCAECSCSGITTIPSGLPHDPHKLFRGNYWRLTPYRKHTHIYHRCYGTDVWRSVGVHYRFTG